MTDLSGIEASVTATTDAEQAAIDLLNQLGQLLKDAGTDPVKLKALSDALDAKKADLAAAVVANTPAA